MPMPHQSSGRGGRKCAREYPHRRAMLLSWCALVLVACAVAVHGQLLPHGRFRGFPMKAAIMLKNRLREKINSYRERNTEMVCYDIVGCFALPHRKSPLQKIPDDPKFLNTKFYLFTRNINFSHPEVLYYDDDGKSLKGSSFNSSNPLKLLVHGYMSKWNEKGALLMTDTYLKLYDCNVILMDWRIGARGPQYATAAANTEVVGRQLGMLLAKMVDSGLNPKNIHLIGFSLGAHVSGTASESIKQKGHLIGRITGLDAASPLFRNNHFREKYKKLDRGDADFVDVLHTDSSPFITDGFGLWEPIGHVDFFPNGGQQQPGCTDPRSSIVKTHFEGTLTRETACSHIRAFHLFIESLLNKLNSGKNYCKFTAFSCPGGLISFGKGLCFPHLDSENSSLALDSSYRSEIGTFGEDVRGEGVMYFNTRGSSPFCGTQLQASVQISQKTVQTRGVLILELFYLTYSVDFHIAIEVMDIVMSGTRMNGLTVAEFNTLDPQKVDVMSAKLRYIDTQIEENKNQTANMPSLYIDRVIVRDMYGNSWQYCKKDTLLKIKYGLETDFLNLNLGKTLC